MAGVSDTAIGYSITFYIKVVISDWRLTPKRRKCLAHNGGGRECLTPQAGGGGLFAYPYSVATLGGGSSFRFKRFFR
jgi:hypothetical protein